MIEIPTGLPSTSRTAVVAPTIYEQGQKSLNEVQELLDQLSSELDDDSKNTVEHRAVLKGVHDELENEERRILNSIERNQIKGVQNAIQRQLARKRRLSRDSGYNSSIGSAEFHQPLTSRRPTESSVDSNYDSIFPPVFAQAAVEGSVFQQNGAFQRMEEVCLAKV